MPAARDFFATPQRSGEDTKRTHSTPPGCESSISTADACPVCHLMSNIGLSHSVAINSLTHPRPLELAVSATLVRTVLSRAGVPPAPQRDRLEWRSFVRQHAATMLACDFSTVDTVWLRRLYVLVFICVGSRRKLDLAADARLFPAEAGRFTSW